MPWMLKLPAGEFRRRAITAGRQDLFNDVYEWLESLGEHYPAAGFHWFGTMLQVYDIRWQGEGVEIQVAMFDWRHSQIGEVLIGKPPKKRLIWTRPPIFPPADVMTYADRIDIDEPGPVDLGALESYGPV